MNRRRIRWVGGIAAVVLLAYLVVRFWLSADFQAVFDRIEVGMADREVEQAFGTPDDGRTDFGRPGPRYPAGEVRYRRSWYGGSAAFEVYFDDGGNVVGKEAYPYPASDRLQRAWSQPTRHLRRAFGL